MKRFELVQKLINEGLSEKTLVNLSDKQLGDLAERMLGEQEINGFKEGPGEKLTPELKHYNTIVKPQLLKAGFKDSYEKVMEPYGTENSMVYGNHNTGVNVVWNRKKGMYSVYVGNDKGLKTFQLGQNDPRLVANNVVKYALSLKGSGTGLNEQSTGKGAVVMNKGTADPNTVKKFTDAGTNVELREKKGGVGPKVTKGHNGIPEFMDSEKLKEKKPSKEKKKETTETKEWVESLAEEKFFHILTSKNEIMEMISSKINEVNGIKFPEMFKYDALKSMDGEVKESGTTTKPAPVKPKVDPGTKPKNPVIPKIIPKQRPKAEKDSEVEKIAA